MPSDLFPSHDKERAESFQDKAIDLAIDNIGIDSKEVASVRLAVDTLKWAAEKNDPDRFGKKEEFFLNCYFYLV